MREILFRGKRTDNGEWITDSETYIRDGDGIWLSDENLNVVTVIPETVGQFTGLTDKNGKRIFEGDIVKGIAYSAERIGVIVWIDEISSFGVRYLKNVNSTAWENSSILRCASMGKTDEFVAEIIGNIHDNPEILKNSNP